MSKRMGKKTNKKLLYQRADPKRMEVYKAIKNRREPIAYAFCPETDEWKEFMKWEDAQKFFKFKSPLTAVSKASEELKHKTGRWLEHDWYLFNARKSMKYIKTYLEGVYEFENNN